MIQNSVSRMVMQRTATQTVWHISDPTMHVEFAAPHAPGWYALRISLKCLNHPILRKRLEIQADYGSNLSDTPLSVIEWNQGVDQRIYFELPQNAVAVRLRFRHLSGEVVVNKLLLTRVTHATAIARAMRLKLRLLADYQCFWPVVKRGGRLLRSGRLREFGRRILNGIPDSQTLRIEVKQTREAGAAWWRRQGPSERERDAIRQRVEAITHPEPITIIIPADRTRIDHARQAVLSVYRQLFPHWQLLLVWADGRVPTELATVVRWDSRTRLVTGETMREATDIALSVCQTDRVIILPPDWELTDDALLEFTTQTRPTDTALSPLPTSANAGQFRPALQPTSLLRSRIAELQSRSAFGVAEWSSCFEDSQKTLEKLLLVPNGYTPATLAPSVVASCGSLIFAADLRRISGWDHVAFAILKGLQSRGVTLLQHPVAKLDADMLPPGHRPELATDLGGSTLVIAPPFLLKRFAPNSRTAILTMWESTQLPPESVTVLNRAGLVIVPSEWGRECFRASGVTVPIEVVPLGYDPGVFYQGVAPSSGKTIFGTAGALSAGGIRKNIPMVIGWFRTAFPQRNDVELRIKITPNCPPLEVPADPRIQITRATMPYPEVAAWNRELTAYVNASAAEGFGLHLLEAMACGVPIISAVATGVQAFFDASVGYAVPFSTVPVPPNEIYRGEWTMPDSAAMIRTMQTIANQPESVAPLRSAAVARARCFTWRDTGRRLISVLEEHRVLVKG